MNRQLGLEVLALNALSSISRDVILDTGWKTANIENGLSHRDRKKYQHPELGITDLCHSRANPI